MILFVDKDVHWQLLNQQKKYHILKKSPTQPPCLVFIYKWESSKISWRKKNGHRSLAVADVNVTLSCINFQVCYLYCITSWALPHLARCWRDCCIAIIHTFQCLTSWQSVMWGKLHSNGTLFVVPEYYSRTETNPYYYFQDELLNIISWANKSLNYQPLLLFYITHTDFRFPTQ